MPLRKKGANAMKGIHAIEQSPKVINNLDSVDYLLNTVDNFIEGVYRDLSITPPQRLSLDASCNENMTYTSRRSPTQFDLSSSSSTSLTSPTGATGSILSTTHGQSTSTSTHRNMDAEIERINRICDNVDQNLRSIGVFMNNPRDDTCTTICEQNRTHSDTSFLTPSIVEPVSPPPTTTTEQETDRQKSPITHPTSVAVIQVIDLSHTQTPDVLRQPYRINNDDDDDDVIIVSANINPIVDLCTPGLEDQPIRRPNIIHSQLGRRRLAEPDYALQQSFTDELGPSTVRRRRTVNSEDLRSSLGTAQAQKSDKLSTNSSVLTPFMCPVCMESCLQRKPTSTKCGHVFCEVCIRRAIRLTHKCPMCNTKISNSEIFRIYL